MKNKPLVYLCSPYSLGDQAINVRCQALMWRNLFNDGRVIPYAPLLSHAIQLITPMAYDAWMRHSLEMLSKCDALYRFDAIDVESSYRQSESKGCDVEVQWCRDHGKLVFLGVRNQLLEWAERTING